MYDQPDHIVPSIHTPHDGYPSSQSSSSAPITPMHMSHDPFSSVHEPLHMMDLSYHHTQHIPPHFAPDSPQHQHPIAGSSSQPTMFPRVPSHSFDSNTMASTELAHSSTPPTAVTRMHHVPHPHAHARHHHNRHAHRTVGTYSVGGQAETGNVDLQLRAEEMARFAGQPTAGS